VSLPPPKVIWIRFVGQIGVEYSVHAHPTKRDALDANREGPVGKIVKYAISEAAVNRARGEQPR